ERFRALTGMLELSNEFFIRTTDPEHKRLVQEFLQRVHDNGYVYKGFYEGWYCPQCADFKTATEIAQGNRCPIHLIELTREREETWFFRLSAFQEPLERLYAERPDFVMPAHAPMIGKDISKFHAVYWPALLMAGGLEPPRQLFVHGFLLGPDDAKMSKSRGNVLDPFAIIESHGADALRHYLFREVTFGQDGPVSQEGFQARYDAELANEYGNLASRTLNMLERYSGGIVPAVETGAPLRAEFAR